jgi:hypothetical protein
MIIIRDCFKPSPRKFCIRSKWGTWCTSRTQELDAILGHLEDREFIFMRDTDSEDCRILFNGRRADLMPKDFFEY